MAVSLTYLNQHGGIAFPFKEDADLTGSISGGGSFLMSNDVFLDIRFITYTQAVLSLTLTSIVVNGAGTTMTVNFSFDGTPIAVAVSAASEWPYRSETLTVGSYSNTQTSLKITFGEGVYHLCQEHAGETITFEDPAVEPSRFTVYNRHKVTGIIGAAPGSDHLTGDVLIEDGYNIQTLLLPSQRILRISAVVGAGQGQPCTTLLPEPTNCEDIIYYINGLHPNWYGDFQLIGGPGVSITNIPESNKIVIHTSLDHCYPKCKDEAE